MTPHDWIISARRLEGSRSMGSQTSRPLKLKERCWIETSRADYPIRQRHIPDGLSGRDIPRV